MKANTFSRRKFLARSSLTAATAVALTVSGQGLNGQAWALSTSVLDKHQADTLTRMSRHIYPHDNLGDMYYAASTEALDGKASSDKTLAKQLKDGLAALDSAMPGKFLDLSEGTQSRIIDSISDTPFFQTVRGHMVVALYNNPLVWRYFGYEGPSFPHGGYLERGFNDINWLPKS